MRTCTATLFVASLITILFAYAAQASPTQVNVRIEGSHETLFEGPVLTEAHDIKASSDVKERSCASINLSDAKNSGGGLTPTTASADAMSIIGGTFDGEWYPGYKDYFITRWGPDSEKAGMSWGVLVNNVFTNVGGCQYELDEGDEVLWVYDAFKKKPFLALYPAADASGPRTLTATAELNKPFVVEVVDYENNTEGKPPVTPERTGSVAYAGADVALVQTAANGFEEVRVEDLMGKTDAQGKARITFTEPGWHRIKATAVNAQGEEDAIRSNRLDVCVPPEGSEGCGELPAEDQVRMPLPAAQEGEAPGGSTKEETPRKTSSANRARLDGTVRFLQEAQNRDGGFGGVKGGQSDPDFSAWVTLALAAAGINPQDQGKPGGADAYSYLMEHAGELKLTTDFERALLVADASGTSPRDFGGIDLVKEVLASKLPEGSFSYRAGEETAEINDTVFAILALSPLHEVATQHTVEQAVKWLVDQQNPDGSWSPIDPKIEAGEIDMTGAAIQALNAAGLRHSEAVEKAFDYLHKAQNPDGGFPELPGEVESNVASTAWAVQGIWAAGQNPEAWIKHAREPLGYMESLQQPDGHIRWKKSQDANGVWMTAYVAPAFAGRALPVPPVPRLVHGSPTLSNSRPTVPSSPIAAEMRASEASHTGKGVIAGGGGNSAPLFSRPQPQSKGDTPGGARLLNDAHKDHPGKTMARDDSGVAPRGQQALSKMRGEQAGGERQIRGALVGQFDSASGHTADKGAPGLQSAGISKSQSSWLAIGIAGAAALLGLLGSQLERRRRQVIV